MVSLPAHRRHQTGRKLNKQRARTTCPPPKAPRRTTEVTVGPSSCHTACPLPFTRANEQYIIARASVKEIIIWFGSRILIKLNVKLPNPSILARTRCQSSKHGLYRSNEFPYPMNITASFGELFFRFHATRFCV